MPRGIYPRCVKRHAITQPQDPSYKLIPLTQGQNTIVDASDYEWLAQWNWCAHYEQHTHSFYAVRRIDGSLTGMHRIILACNPNEEADHRNHDTLDNRKQNLRKCVRAQNALNLKHRTGCSSAFKGVRWRVHARKWYAEIAFEKHRISLGYFATEQEAALAYDAKARELFGEFAWTNFKH